MIINPPAKKNRGVRTCIISGVFHFSIIDIVSLVVQTNRPRQWWHDYKTKDLGKISVATGEPTWKNQLVHEIVRTKVKSSDGKRKTTEMAPAKTALRILNLIGNKSVLMTYKTGSPTKENLRHEKIRISQIVICRSFILKMTRGARN